MKQMALNNSYQIIGKSAMAFIYEEIQKIMSSGHGFKPIFTWNLAVFYVIRGCHCKQAQEDSSFHSRGLGSSMAQPLCLSCLPALPSQVGSPELGADGITGTFTACARRTGTTETCEMR